MVWSSPEKLERDLKARPVSNIIKWLIIAVLVVAGLTFLVIGIATGWSYWGGKAALVREKNSSDNFVSAQGQFTQENQDYGNYLHVTIPTAKKALDQFNKAHPTIPGDLSGLSLSNQQETLSDNLAGLVASCARVAGDYNAQTQDYLSADFRNHDLPVSLDAASCTAAGS